MAKAGTDGSATAGGPADGLTVLSSKSLFLGQKVKLLLLDYTLTTVTTLFFFFLIICFCLSALLLRLAAKVPNRLAVL